MLFALFGCMKHRPQLQGRARASLARAALVVGLFAAIGCTNDALPSDAGVELSCLGGRALLYDDVIAHEGKPCREQAECTLLGGPPPPDGLCHFEWSNYLICVPSTLRWHVAAWGAPPGSCELCPADPPVDKTSCWRDPYPPCIYGEELVTCEQPYFLSASCEDRAWKVQAQIQLFCDGPIEKDAGADDAGTEDAG